MTDPLLSLPEQKALLRAAMRGQRQADVDRHAGFPEKMARLFLQHVSLKAGAVIAGYSAFRNEADPAFLLAVLRERGHSIALPRIVGKKLPLSFYRHERDDPLVSNSIGILEPAAAPALAVEPDIVLVPLLAFDKSLNRLGYGGGFYDKTLTGLRQHKPILAVGIAYANQEVEAVPVGVYDTRLDKIVTDVNIF